MKYISGLRGTAAGPITDRSPGLAGQGRKARSQGEGQVLVLFALFSVVLLGAMALAIDVGYLLSERRDAQAAADASALAGARALLGGESTAAVVDAAEEYAVANGLPGSDSGDSDISVVVEGDRWNGTVEVDVSMQVNRFFLGAIYTGPWEVGAHAVAETSDKSDSQYALIALDPPGINVNGDMSVEVSGGGIISNENISTNGSSTSISTDGFLDAVGTIDEDSDWYAAWGIRERRAPALDPFDSYTAPPKPGGPPKTGNYRCNPHGWEDAVWSARTAHFHRDFTRTPLFGSGIGQSSFQVSTTSTIPRSNSVASQGGLKAPA